MCELQCVWGQYTLYWGVRELQYVCVCCGGGGGGNMSTLTILNICAERPCVASPSPLQLRAKSHLLVSPLHYLTLSSRFFLAVWIESSATRTFSRARRPCVSNNESAGNALL